MCGISGIVSTKGIDSKNLISMTQLVHYRGPDGFGFAHYNFADTPTGECWHNHEPQFSSRGLSIGLGHRRLAILDLSELGNQPMQLESGTLCITYNGEVYNYTELRQELEIIGYSFQSGTDTEVILRAYQAWGSDCVNHFRGMWSFAILDVKQRTLFCSRDRFGIKPFYYYFDSQCFIFSSEIKQILEYPGISRHANDKMVYDFLEYGLIDHTSETFFEGIYSLPAGSSLIVHLDKAALSCSIDHYWDLNVSENTPLSFEKAEQLFLEKFSSSLRLHMRSDVPVGSCLSGGLDSSSIVCLVKQMFPEGEFHTFSSCFSDPKFDEREYINAVVDATHVEPHFAFPSYEDFLKNFETLIWHQDEPISGASVFAQWCVMKAAKQAEIPVLLDGQGGDETLCGYRKFYFFYLKYLYSKKNPRFFVEFIAALINGGISRFNFEHYKRYIKFRFMRVSSPVKTLGEPEFKAKFMDRKIDLWGGNNLQDRQKHDLTTFSLPALLHYEDRNSMAHSVEARVPFLDHELAEFSVGLEPSMKLRGGWTKQILRESLKGILPEKVRHRKVKMGFEAPQHEWLRNAMKSELFQSAFNKSALLEKYFDSSKVLQELHDFENGCNKLTPTELFHVFCLTLWGNIFKLQ